MTASTTAEMSAPIAERRRSGDGRTDWAGYLFVSFFTLPFLLFNVAPIFFGIAIAFTRWGIMGAPHWVGLKNFTNVLKDDWVAQAFTNTLLYGLIIVPGVVVLGLIFALYVNKGWPLSGLARVLFFSPNVVSSTVIGLVWVWMLDTQFGLVNHYLGFLGIANIPWITSTRWSLVGVSMASIWWDLGLAFILFLAALQDLPKELNEAAEVDGASRLAAAALRHPAAAAARHQHGDHPAADRQPAHLQPGLRDDQWRPGRLLDLGHLLYLPDRHLSPSLRTGLRRLHAALRHDPRRHGAAALADPGAVGMADRVVPVAAGPMGPARRINRQLRPFGLTIGTIPVWLGGLAIAIAWGAPFVWMVSTSLKLPGEVMTVDIEWLPRHVTFDNYRRIFSEYPVLRWGFNSLLVAVRQHGAQRADRRHGGLCAGAHALSRPRSALRALPRLPHGPDRGLGRAAAARHDQDRLGQYLSGPDPAHRRQRLRRLHLPAVLPQASRATSRMRRAWMGPGIS